MRALPSAAARVRGPENVFGGGEGTEEGGLLHDKCRCSVLCEYRISLSSSPLVLAFSRGLLRFHGINQESGEALRGGERERLARAVLEEMGCVCSY